MLSIAWLFGDPRSPWVPLIGREGSRLSYHVARLISSPMVEVPAFRKMLLAALDDRSPVGTAKVGDNGVVTIQIKDGFSMGRGALKDDRDPPAPGTEVPIRMCDFYAWELAELKGAPTFNPCWPEPRRTSAVAAIADFLKHKATRD